MGAPDPPEHLGSSVSAERLGFTQQVRDALAHLHDPGYLEAHPLTCFLRAEASSQYSTVGRALRRAILDAMESMKPGEEGSASTHSYRAYQILKLRFVDALEISQVEDRISLSKSPYYVELKKAVEGLSAVLWQRWGLGEASVSRERQASPSRHDGDFESGVRERRGGRKETEEEAREEGAERALTNLPLQLTSFVGRERETAEVERLLQTTRLLTLTGTGGCGKTRLAVECALSICDAYPDGVWLVQLAPISDPELVPTTVATCLGVRETARESIVATLIRHFRSRRALLVFDSCEHLVGGCAKLADALLSACPTLTILATSRQPLGIQGETNLRVPSLSSPPAEERSREAALQAVLAHDASRLFVDRARSALPSFAANVSNSTAIGEVCRRLDGIPLAIELAAARVQALSPDQIASRLDHDFQLLTGGSRTALPRQQTLKATLDWSHDLLFREERVLLRRLSVFAGGFALEAAEVIATGEGIEELGVVNLLTQLIDKSLVEAETGQGDARYRLLEPVRQYAWHRLEDAGELAWARDRHRHWYVALSQRIYEGWFDLQEGQLQRVRLDYDNLRAVLEWCLERDAQSGLTIVGYLWPFWDTEGRFSEGHRWCAEYLARTCERGIARARALRGLGWLRLSLGDSEGSLAALEESLELCRQADDRRELSLASAVLGTVLGRVGDPARASLLLEEAIEIGRALGFEYVTGRSTFWLALLHHRMGSYDEAARCLDGLVMPRELADVGNLGWMQWCRGLVALEQGDLPGSGALLRESLGTFRRYRLTIGESTVLWGLGLVALATGDRAEARRLLTESLTLAGRAELRVYQPDQLILGGLVAWADGEKDRAVRLLGSAESNARLIGYPFTRGMQARLDTAAAQARAYLGEEAFSRAWTEGQAMTLEQAVDDALRADEPQGIA